MSEKKQNVPLEVGIVLSLLILSCGGLYVGVMYIKDMIITQMVVENVTEEIVEEIEEVQNNAKRFKDSLIINETAKLQRMVSDNILKDLEKEKETYEKYKLDVIKKTLDKEKLTGQKRLKRARRLLEEYKYKTIDSLKEITKGE